MTVQDTGRGIEMYNYWLAKRQHDFQTSRKEGLKPDMAAFLSGMAEGRKQCADDLAVFLKGGEVET